jgi:hypothetical protein
MVRKRVGRRKPNVCSSTTKEVAMTRVTQRRNMSFALAAAAAALAVGAALAHGGYGPGYGMGAGMGYGAGCGMGPGPVAGGGPGCGAGYGPGPGGRAPALLSQEELAAHRAKMHSLTSYDECKAYVTDFSKQLQARAKETGQPAWGPTEVMCDRMKAHGHFTQ